MGTTSSATSSLANSTSPTYFNGTSTFSTDLQNAITREVQIASLPITQMQSDETTLNSQTSELSTLTSKFTDLQTTVQNIDTAVSGSSFSTDVSAPAVLTANVTDGATEGNYTVLVQDVGAYSTSMSSSTWQATKGAANTYQLLVGGKSYNITPSDNSAGSVAAAINSQEGNLVQATVVNVGSQSTPDYRISLRSSTLDANPVNLQLSGSSLQAQQVTGRPAQYEVNGSGTTVTSNTDTVTISPGLTVTMLASSSTAVNVTLTRSSTALGAALSDFANAFNAAVDAVAGQRGQTGGALQGNPVVLDLANILGQIGTYNSQGASVNSLASVGLTLGADGHLTYDATGLLSADLTDSGSVTSFFGSAAKSGFLQMATNELTTALDPTVGDLPSSTTAIQTQLTSMNANITTKQAQIAQLQTQLTNQMATADSLISSMQQQYTYLTGMFQAMQTADLQYAHA